MSNPALKLHTPARYRICVQGSLDPSWSDWLEGMSVTIIDEGIEAPVTILVGWLSDQAALMGVLEALYNWHHCPLLSVEFIGSA